jgi:hypothetical protein
MADIDNANFHPCFMQYKSTFGVEGYGFESHMLESLKQTRTATGLERLIGRMDEHGVELSAPQSLVKHAVKLDSIIVTKRLLSTRDALVEDKLVASAKSEEMKALLIQFRSSATHPLDTGFESDSGSGTESESEPEKESDNS